MDAHDPVDLAAQLKAIALALGFDRAGIARLAPTPESRAFADWIARGRHGEMAWLARHVEKRIDPRMLFEGARSALVVSLVYDQPPPAAPAPIAPEQRNTTEEPASGGASGAAARSEAKASEVARLAVASAPSRADGPPAPSAPEQEDSTEAPASGVAVGDGARSEPQASEVERLAIARARSRANGPTAPNSSPSPTARIARYARGTDYHDLLLPRLRSVGDALEALVRRPLRWRAWVDTGPVLERVLAAYAGLGWIGKNGCLIDPALGSFTFLGVLATDLDLATDPREPDHCGSCRACLDACPTDAFAAPYVLDATRCLAYTTIELRGAIPEPLRAGQGDWAFGCDVCQDVCPWNRRSHRRVPPDRAGLRAALAPRAEWESPALAWLLSLDEEAWRASTRRSALRRAKHRGLVRNALVAAGNAGDPGLLPSIARWARGPDPVLAEHARWALERLWGIG